MNHRISVLPIIIVSPANEFKWYVYSSKIVLRRAGYFFSWWYDWPVLQGAGACVGVLPNDNHARLLPVTRYSIFEQIRKTV